MPNILSIKIGDTTYDVKDQVARDHLVEVGTAEPTPQSMHPDNRLYVKDYGSIQDENDHTYVIPTMDEFNDLKSALDYNDAFTSADLVSGYAINVNMSVGETLTMNPTTRATTGYLILNVLKGDIITLTGEGETWDRLWAFADLNKKLLSKSDADISTGNTPIVLTAESDGYFITNHVLASNTIFSLHINGLTNCEKLRDQIEAIKTGADGITYDSPAEAINSQFNNVSEIRNNHYAIELSASDFESGMINASTGENGSGSSYIRTSGFITPKYDVWLCFLKNSSLGNTVTNLTVYKYNLDGTPVQGGAIINTFTKNYIGAKLEKGYKYRYSMKISNTSSEYWNGAIAQIQIKRNFITENVEKDVSPVYAVSKSVRDFMASADYDSDDYTYTNITNFCEHKAWRNDVCTPAIIKWDYVENAVAIYVTLHTNATTMQGSGYGKTYTASPETCKLAIYNLIPGVTYYYIVYAVLADGTTVMLKYSSFTISNTVTTRMLTIDKIENVRDIGGYSVGNGHVKYEKIIRGGNIHNPLSVDYDEFVTDSGIIEMAKRIGIKSELDLTGQNENTIGWTYSTQNFPFYTAITSSDGKTQMRSAFTTVLANLEAGKPVYVHCQGGCDRTGTLVTILLGCLGVSESDLSKEYELSSFSSFGGYGSRRRDVSSQTVDYMGLITIIKTYTGDTLKDKIIAYLEDCGVTSEQITAFAGQMIE